MADSSSDDDNYVTVVANPKIAVAMQMSRETLLHVVDICAAKITRILPPVGERMGTWGLCANGSVDAGL